MNDLQGIDEREGSPDSTDNGAQQVQSGGLVQVAVLTLYLIYFTLSAIQASPSNLALLAGAYSSNPSAVSSPAFTCRASTLRVHYYYG